MMPVLVATALSLVIAAGFAALGEVVLWRRSRDLFSWNESFLVGAGVSAAALFPLSLISGRYALAQILGALGLALAIVVIRHWRARGRIDPNSRRDRRIIRDPAALGLLTLLSIVTLSFAALNFRYPYLWDGFQIWASKAQILYHQGRLTPEWYPGTTVRPLSLSYPPLVPLDEALLGVLRGGFDFDSLKPIFLVFYVSMLLSTFAAVRSRLSTRSALSATLLLALVPVVSTGTSAGGYADMPVAAFVAGAMAAGLRTPVEGGRRDPLPWLIGSLTTVKSEGLLLALSACIAMAAIGCVEKPRRLPERFRGNAAGLVTLSAFIGLRWGYLRWIHLHDLTYGPLDSSHFKQAWSRILPAASLCGRELLDPQHWALLWPAFFLTAALQIVRGSTRERALALSTVVALAVYSGIFLFSNWGLEDHIPNAFPRLLVQLAPAAILTVVFGYARLRGLPEAAETG
jgi:hypothetical protein